MAKKKSEPMPLSERLMDENPTSGIKSLGEEDFAIVNEGIDSLTLENGDSDDGAPPLWAASLFSKVERKIDANSAHTLSLEERVTQIGTQARNGSPAPQVSVTPPKSRLEWPLGLLCIFFIGLLLMLLWPYTKRIGLWGDDGATLATSSAPAPAFSSSVTPLINETAIRDEVAQLADQIAGLSSEINQRNIEMGGEIGGLAARIDESNEAKGGHPAEQHDALASAVAVNAALVKKQDDLLQQLTNNLLPRVKKLEELSHESVAHKKAREARERGDQSSIVPAPTLLDTQIPPSVVMVEPVVSPRKIAEIAQRYVPSDNKSN